MRINSGNRETRRLLFSPIGVHRRLKLVSLFDLRVSAFICGYFEVLGGVVSRFTNIDRRLSAAAPKVRRQKSESRTAFFVQNHRRVSATK